MGGLAPVGGTGSSGAKGAFMGWGSHGLPSKPAKSWASCHPPQPVPRSRNGCMSQERSQVSGSPVGPLGSQQLWGRETTQAVPAAVPSAWCARVSPGRTLSPLSPLLIRGPPRGSVLICWLSSLPTQFSGSLQPWCGGDFLLVSCVIRRGTLMCSWGS